MRPIAQGDRTYRVWRLFELFPCVASWTVSLRRGPPSFKRRGLGYISQEWLDDRVHLLEADTCAMSLINGGDWAPARRKRRSWSVEDKRRIVEESLADGASIAEVARRHDLNANQLFTLKWLDLFEQPIGFS